MISLLRMFFRSKLESNDFFKDISFEPNENVDINELKHDILDYFYYLYVCTGKTIAYFRDFFPDFIVGNVTVSGSFGLLDIADSTSDTYILNYKSPTLHLLFSNLHALQEDYYSNIDVFTFVKANDNVFGNYSCTFENNHGIVKSYILSVRSETTLQIYYSVKFDYIDSSNSKRILATIENAFSTITIDYSNFGIDFSDLFLNYAKIAAPTYDVFPLCKKILTTARSEDTISITSSSIILNEKMVLSKIEINQNKVISYFYSEPLGENSFTLKHFKDCNSLADIEKRKTK